MSLSETRRSLPGQKSSLRVCRYMQGAILFIEKLRTTNRTENLGLACTSSFMEKSR